MSPQCEQDLDVFVTEAPAVILVQDLDEKIRHPPDQGSFLVRCGSILRDLYVDERHEAPPYYPSWS